MTIQAFERSPRWIARCSKVLFAIGWITFVLSVTSPILHRLAWRYEMIGLLLGPVLMFSGLVEKYASRPKKQPKPCIAIEPPTARGWLAF